MVSRDKPLAWLHGEIRTPPFSEEARLEAGFLLRKIQQGEKLSMPQSRPMPSIGTRCHELRINDANKTWRIVHRIDSDAIVILEVFEKEKNWNQKVGK
ncbi:MAG: type II toxin-antitoxin system RelE/ParE family toxin [Deltaproteobacteria bacterium]|nr:type II toxin-antitoxin system RelE/ParE family toxin [Deltaproteobacteria bacterium]